VIKYLRTTLIVFSILIPVAILTQTGLGLTSDIGMPILSKFGLWLGFLVANIGNLAIAPLCLFAAHQIKPFGASS